MPRGAPVLKTWADLAKALDVSRDTVRRWFRDDYRGFGRAIGPHRHEITGRLRVPATALKVWRRTVSDGGGSLRRGAGR